MDKGHNSDSKSDKRENINSHTLRFRDPYLKSKKGSLTNQRKRATSIQNFIQKDKSIPHC